MGHEHMKQIEEKIHREQQKLVIILSDYITFFYFELNDESNLQEEEAIFANLWYQDIQAKKDREDRDARKQAERNRQVADILKEQMLVLEKQKEEEKIIRAQNARLLVIQHYYYLSLFDLLVNLIIIFQLEKQNIEKLEKEMQFQKKRDDQAHRRQELDQCVK